MMISGVESPLMIQFSLVEILSLIGLAQALYAMVYLLLRSGSAALAVVPVFYFLMLSGGFLLDAAAGRWAEGRLIYDLLRWFFWSGSVPLAALLIFQIALIVRPPEPRHFLLLLLVPLSFLPVLLGEVGEEMVYIGGIVSGGFSLLTVWFSRHLLEDVRSASPTGRDRFWLILALIAVNVGGLAAALAFVSDVFSQPVWVLIRTLLGIAIVYLGATSLFRIYPQAVKLTRRVGRGDDVPVQSEQDSVLLSRLHTLFHEQKVYQEQTIGRAELARELGVGEATLSRLVNAHYGKTIPQILNEWRVKDAQKLLEETNVPVQAVYEESGFASVTTFYRVFKELTGVSPSDYRELKRKIG